MIHPDEQIWWEYGIFKLNNTILTTWVLMILIVLGAGLITRNLSVGMQISRWQHVLEIIVLAMKDQIREVGITEPDRHLPFIGTLFTLIAVAGLCTIFPVYIPPTSSLSTTTALALCVFVAVPYYGIVRSGLKSYLRTYFKPSVFMMPFNIISEFSRTIALAIRLFGNMMSGAMIISILLSIAPFIFPAMMNVLGLMTSMVQAYIFSILATVFIAAALRDSAKEGNQELNKENHG